MWIVILFWKNSAERIRKKNRKLPAFAFGYLYFRAFGLCFCRRITRCGNFVLFVPNTGAEKHKLQPTQHDSLALSLGFGQESVDDEGPWTRLCSQFIQIQCPSPQDIPLTFTGYSWHAPPYFSPYQIHNYLTVFTIQAPSVGNPKDLLTVLFTQIIISNAIFSLLYNLYMYFVY